MALQKEVQDYLVRHARDTEYGHAHLFANIHDYDSFAAHIPLNTYEELKEYIDRMRHGESQHPVAGQGEMVCQVVGNHQR